MTDLSSGGPPTPATGPYPAPPGYGPAPAYGPPPAYGAAPAYGPPPPYGPPPGYRPAPGYAEYPGYGGYGYPVPPRRRGGVVLAVVLVLVPLLFITGVGIAAWSWTRAHHPAAARSWPRGTSAPTAQERFATEVHAALEARTKALRARDERAFLAGFDPAQPKLVAAQRLTFRNLVKLPLITPGYRTEEPWARDTRPATTEGDAQVTLVEQVRGADLRPVGSTRREHWVRRGGRLVVAESEPTAWSSRSEASPVSMVPLNVINGRLVTIAGTADVTNLRSVSATAERAAASVRKMWGNRPGPTRFVVFVSHSSAAMRSWFGGDDGGGALGITKPMTAMDGDRAHYAGARVVVDLRRTPSKYLYTTMRHEFTHAVTTLAKAVPTSGSEPYPAWAEEGFAAWSEEADVPLAKSQRLQELRYFRRYWHGELPPDTRAAFYTGEPLVFVHYDAAAMVFRYVATRWGATKAIAMYTHIIGGRSGAAREVLGVEPAAFERGWAAWVTKQLRA
jgi:hypothetical protein